MEKINGDQVSANYTKVVLYRQQTAFVDIHGIFPGSFTAIATNQEATGRSMRIPRLLRSHGVFSIGWECTCQLKCPGYSGFWWSLCSGNREAGPWNMLVGWFLWDFCGSHFQWSIALKGRKYFPAKHRICYFVSSSIHRLLIKSFSSQKIFSFLVFPNARTFLGCMIVFLGSDESYGF